MNKEGPWKMESVQEAAGAATAEWERSAPRCGGSCCWGGWGGDSAIMPLGIPAPEVLGGPQAAMGLSLAPGTIGAGAQLSPLYLRVHYKGSRPKKAGKPADLGQACHLKSMNT